MNDKLKAAEIRPCAFCGKGLGQSGMPLFYRIDVQRFTINSGAVREVDAMERFFAGHVAIARTFCNPDVAEGIAGKLSVLACMECVDNPQRIMTLLEKETEKRSDANQ